MKRMEELDALSQWTRIDIGLQDAESLRTLMCHIARLPVCNPAFIALIGALSDRVVLRDNPEIQAILQNRLPCSVIARKSATLHAIPKSVVSVYNRTGSEVFYIRFTGYGQRAEVASSLDRNDTSPPDEIELDLSELDSECSRSLTLIFSLAHSIIWFHSDKKFSNYDLRLLKIVDLARLKGLKSFQSKLEEITDNKDWIREGSLCCPRLVFVFSGLSAASDELEVEKDLSVRIYTILKKCRLISIPRSSGLCFLSANKETVVHVPEKVASLSFKKDENLGSAEEKDNWPYQSGSNRNEVLGMQQTRHEGLFGNMLKSCTADILATNSISANLRPAGFPWPSHFYKPSLAEWFAAAIQLHILLYRGEEFRYLLDAKLGPTMSISRKYSKSVAAFSINNFELRSDEPGTQQLSYGLYSYMQFARGPAGKNYGVVLARFISDHVYPRRQCSAHSILGSPCVKLMHLTPQQQTKVPRSSKKARLPVLYHQSRVSFVSFCSCGRTAHQRLDPFTVREANELFYETMDFKCCSLLECRIDFPSRTADRKDKKVTEEKRVEVVPLKRYDSFPELSTTVTLNDKEKNQPASSIVPEAPTEQTQRASKLPSPLMFQVGMSSDVAPKISSWVIHGLGPANRYRHSYGLEHHIQADFLNLYHHLIPFEAEIQLTHSHKISRNVPNRPTQTLTVEPRPWHSSIFFGLDFECPKGHRFIYKSKEIFDLVADGKDDEAQSAAEDILRNGAPLFLRCPCRSSAATENKQFIAQLMRIHIVTPKDPIQLAILPKVKVGRGIPTFSPGTEIPVNLGANIYYVLRLPFCYYDSAHKKGPFCATRSLLPKHRKLPYSGFLEGGFLRFMESSVDRM